MDALSNPPSKTQAMVNALRGLVGMRAQQTTGPATNVQSAYRDYQIEAAQRGETPLPLQDWMNSQQLQQTGAPLR